MVKFMFCALLVAVLVALSSAIVAPQTGGHGSHSGGHSSGGHQSSHSGHHDSSCKHHSHSSHHSSHKPLPVPDQPTPCDKCGLKPSGTPQCQNLTLGQRVKIYQKFMGKRSARTVYFLAAQSTEGKVSCVCHRCNVTLAKTASGLVWTTDCGDRGAGLPTQIVYSQTTDGKMESFPEYECYNKHFYQNVYYHTCNAQTNKCHFDNSHSSSSHSSNSHGNGHGNSHHGNKHHSSSHHDNHHVNWMVQADCRQDLDNEVSFYVVAKNKAVYEHDRSLRLWLKKNLPYVYNKDFLNLCKGV